VLVADDERTIAETLAAILTHSGFETRAVYSGKADVEMKTKSLVSPLVPNDSIASMMSYMPRVLLNFQHYRDAWTVHFIQDDCRSGVGSRTRYFRFPALDDLRSFVTRCHPEDATLAGFEHSVRSGTGAASMSI
jgi:hypothetical protein